MFEFSVLEECMPADLIEREQFCINALKPNYNICKIAGNTLGRICSEETRKKISESNKGARWSEEDKIKMSISRKGRKHKKFSLEARLKMSEARKGKPSPNKGKHFGPLKGEHKEKVSEAGRKSLIAYNKSKIGTKLSEETKQKIRNKLKNRTFTKEHRKKLSEAAKNYLKRVAGACPI